MTDQQTPAQPVFQIEKIYIKDLSVEVPNAPAIFLEREAPNIDIQLNTQSTPIEEGVFQTVLTITATAKVQDKTAFLVEVQQAGIFRIQNVPQDAMEPMLAVGCPNILYPYARESVSDAVLRSGFPPLLMQPVNFEAMYLQQRQAATQKPN
jgi:preprotein translocase subunit SecB